MSDYPLLEAIQSPADLRELDSKQLPELAEQLRQYLIDTISQCGGHFAAGLGTVELTIALHYLYNTPEDQLIWDVGHQAYPHKVLTGRRKELLTIRQPGGLHPFPWPKESDYDAFAVGHSSTSVSAALGMALADKLQERERHVVAIIGDGAMTAGMAFEALNHAGHTDTNMLVILNDNDMSISENVGGLNNYLAKILSGRTYATMREGSRKVLSKIPSVWDFAQRAEEHMKGMIVPGTLFEELGFNYIGPINGHDLPTLLKTLSNMQKLKGPQFLHIATKKGKGYEPAEQDPIKYHALSSATPVENTGKTKKTYSQIFGQWLCDTASQNDKLVAITPAMREGSGMVEFSRQFPERYHDVGIAEQHAVTLAAGLAIAGMKAVVAIYSSFLQRAYDQLIHDVALQELDVLFAIDRAGLVGGDGATHHGAFDLSYLRCIPNLIIMTPSDEQECRMLLSTGFEYQGPAAVRYPRGKGTGIDTQTALQTLPIGKAKIELEGKNIAILAFGSMVTPAIEAGQQLQATVINMRFVKPLDTELLTELAKTHEQWITIEENAVTGGAGSAVLEWLQANNFNIQVKQLGLPDQFIHHGEPEQQLVELGLDAQGIITACQKI